MGANPATEWNGLLAVDETPHLLNPKSGWLYNSNNWPWSAAGASSLKKEDYPAYVESGVESARGLHAIRVLQDKKDFTLDSLIAAAYDSYLPWFEKPIPALVKAWDELPAGDALAGEGGGADRGCCGSGICGGAWIRCRLRWRCFGGGNAAARPVGASVQALAGGFGQADGGFRKLEDALGRDQPIPEADGGYRAAVQRCGAEYSGGLYVGGVGFAGFIRGAALSGDEEVVWDEREQLCGGGGVWG